MPVEEMLAKLAGSATVEAVDLKGKKLSTEQMLAWMRGKPGAPAGVRWQAKRQKSESPGHGPRPGVTLGG